MVLAKTNGRYYNMYYIASIKKIGDTEIEFTGTNSMKYIEKYPDSDTRDKVFDNLEKNFVVDVDN